MVDEELRTIQQNQKLSAELERAVAEFLQRGGVINAVDGFSRKQKAYGRQINASKPLTHRRKRQTTQAAAPKPPVPSGREAMLAQQLEQARELAKTMPLTEAARASGLSKHMLKRFASEGGFTYRRYDPTPPQENVQTDSIDPISDVMNVLRIKEARDRGLSRKAAKDLIGISNTLMERLIADYRIDYPLRRVSRK